MQGVGVKELSIFADEWGLRHMCLSKRRRMNRPLSLKSKYTERIINMTVYDPTKDDISRANCVIAEICDLNNIDIAKIDVAKAVNIVLGKALSIGCSYRYEFLVSVTNNIFDYILRECFLGTDCDKTTDGLRKSDKGFCI
jgi:hypothetical protein